MRYICDINNGDSLFTKGKNQRCTLCTIVQINVSLKCFQHNWHIYWHLVMLVAKGFLQQNLLELQSHNFPLKVSHLPGRWRRHKSIGQDSRWLICDLFNFQSNSLTSHAFSQPMNQLRWVALQTFPWNSEDQAACFHAVQLGGCKRIRKGLLLIAFWNSCHMAGVEAPPLRWISYGWDSFLQSWHGFPINVKGTPSKPHILRWSATYVWAYVLIQSYVHTIKQSVVLILIL